jgi:PIN domain nuclease of toxin-antitoxin system
VGGRTLILLDTHPLIWLDQDDPALGLVARQSINAALNDNCLTVSAISFWELAMLVAKGRIVMDLLLPAWRQDLLDLGLIEIPVDGEVG